MALVQPLRERDGGCFATAWELALGVLERDDSSSESSLWRRVSAVHDSVPALVEHLASGCHGDAVASAPSTLPFLALLPVDALTSLPPPPPPSGTSPSETPSGTSGTSPSGTSETSPAASIVAATWEGWRTCCTPSRSNDAAALLRAHAEATLYCVLVAAKKASDPRRFREVVLDASIATRWAPEALRADPASRSDVRTTLCDALATLSARAELTRATDACWDAVARASVELMRGGECGGGVVKIDAAGAARCRAFHAELLAAAERKRPGGDATWVNDRYATPIARVAYERASRANANAASARLSAAAASTLAALVTAHGVTCLGDGASASEIATRCLAASDDDDGGGAWTTTIVVAPRVDAFAGDFGAMLDAQEVIDEALVVSGLEGEVQCVAFHPSFVFAGESPDDAGNFTNRSPWPSWHILREIDVSDAVDDFAVDARETPARNARNLREIGYDALAEALVRFQRE